MLQARFTHNLIIDGHGKELTGTNFNFQRPQGRECDLYCYIRQGLGIGINQSNTIIRDAINGNISRELAGTQLSSRIGGTLVIDKMLYAIKTTGGIPQWNNDSLLGVNGNNVVINGVTVTEFVAGFNTYIRLPFNSSKSVKLSDIINFYNGRQYNILWCVCRVE